MPTAPETESLERHLLLHWADHFAVQELTRLTLDVLGNSSRDHRRFLPSLFRVIARMEMTERIPEWKSLDVQSGLSEARSKGCAWIPETISQYQKHLEGLALQKFAADALVDPS